MPDVQAARRVGAPIVTRAELLAELFNAAAIEHRRRRHQRQVDHDGMIGWILRRAGRDPTIMNGAVMKNFVTADVAVRQRRGRRRAASSSARWTRATARSRSTADHRGGEQHLARPQVDGRAARAVPRLRRQGADRVVLNLDNAETAALAAGLDPRQADDLQPAAMPRADLAGRTARADAGRHRLRGAARDAARRADVALQMPGEHNVANALAAIAAADALRRGPGRRPPRRCPAFTGVKRRLDVVGEAGRRHRDRRLRPQPRQDRRDARHAARLSRAGCW